MKLNSVLLLTFFITTLSSCGFYSLRSYDVVANKLPNLYVATDSPYDPLINELKQNLRSINVNLATSAKDAPFTLQIINSSFNYATPSIGLINQTQVCKLTYQINFVLRDRADKTILGPQILTTARSITISANQPLSSNDQLTIVKQEMQRDLISQLLNYLNSPQTAQKL